jgi:hypothetical protein
MAPPHTFFDAVLDADDAAELIELEAEVELFDNELAIEDVAELSEADAFDAPFKISLLPDEMEELAESERLEPESETTEAAELRLLDAFSTMPGSFPTIDSEARADRLLALSLATETTLSILPCGVPMTELDA